MDNTCGLGWLPQLPDIRDYTPDHPEIAALLAKTPLFQTTTLPNTVDLRQWCSPIENQGNIGSCTAHTAVALMEYFERKTYGRYVDASRLFVYKTTRKLMHRTGDVGGYLRVAMRALVMFGAPPEEFYPYDVAKYDEEPPAFCYALAANYKAIKYFRLDPLGTTKANVLNQIKTYAAAGMPSMFGFSIYQSAYSATGGKIPFPTTGDSLVGGHAVNVVGYDDAYQITNSAGVTTIGAFLIRNSWGTSWGISGYGWLPYDYVLKGLATDFWAVQSATWVDPVEFR